MADTLRPYQSPVRLLRHAAEATAPYSPQAMSRARKKILAEIALGGGEIVIDEMPYSRHDASTLLHNISEEQWRVHCILYTFPGMLQFLEKQVFVPGAFREVDAYRHDPCFTGVVSPFFAYSFNAVSGLFIREKKFDCLLLLLPHHGFLLPDHQHEAFQKVRTYLDGLNYTLRNLSWEKFIADESILHFVFEPDWQKSMNALPAAFNTLRDEMVEHLIGIVLRFQQKATWYYLHQVLLHLRALDTNESNQQEIARIDKVIFVNTQMESKRERSEKGGSRTRRVFWGIWVLLMVLRGATCNSYGDSNTYGGGAPQPPQPASTLGHAVEQQNEKLLLQHLDSLLKGERRSTEAAALHPGNPAFPFSEELRAAGNDSLWVVNHTGYDAVLLYFKDIPGHALSGKLPKIYSALLRRGESQKIFMLAGKGRVYFAFGRGWGKLKKPVSIPFPDYAGKLGIVEPLHDSLLLPNFFSDGKGLQQKYLQKPALIQSNNTPKDTVKYFYRNSSITTGAPTLYLSVANGSFQIKANGPLLVKEAR